MFVSRKMKIESKELLNTAIEKKVKRLKTSQSDIR